MILECWILLVTSFLTFYLICKSGRKGLPPGPTRWPLIGNIFEIALADHIHPHLALAKLSNKYGDIMKLALGVHDTIILSSFEPIKEIMTHNDALGRYEFPFVRDRAFGKRLGIIFGSGEMWKAVRRFTVKGLANVGFGKGKSMEAEIRSEADELISDIMKKAERNNGIYEVDQMQFGISNASTLWSLVGGHKFPKDDENFIRFIKMSDKQVEIMSNTNIYIAYPILRHLFPKWTKFDQHLVAYEELHEFIKKIIEDHRNAKANSIEEGPSNFIDAFLEEIKKNADNPDGFFTEEQLVVTIQDLFLAGSETSSTLQNWLILFLVLNPNVQQKMQREISETIPADQPISIGHIQRMPYLQATIFEALRLSCFGPINPARECLQNIKYKEYTFPKGMSVTFNLYPVFMDKAFWGDPQVFRPERFLDAAGQTLVKSRTERVASFGFGKRICIGENLAKDSTYFYITTLLRSCSLEVVKGREPTAENPQSLITVRPQPYCVKLVPREH